MELESGADSLIRNPDDRHHSCVYRKTRANMVRKVVREVYLRDIGCGVLDCLECANDVIPGRLVADQPILVLDTTSAMSQMDFIASDMCVDNVWVLSTVLNHLREKNMEAYARLRTLCRSLEEKDAYQPIVKGLEVKAEVNGRRFFVFSNEFSRDTFLPANPGESASSRDERAVLSAVGWLQSHLTSQTAQGNQQQVRVILLTEDRRKRIAAKSAGVEAMSCARYVRDVAAASFPGCGEKLAGRHVVADDEDDAYATQREVSVDSSKRRKESETKDSVLHEEALDGELSVRVLTKAAECVYPAHWSSQRIADAKAENTVVEGRIQMAKGSCFSAYLRLPNGAEVLIRGRERVNRSLDGDIVAVQLLAGGAIGNDSEGNGGDRFDANEAGVAVSEVEKASEEDTSASDSEGETESVDRAAAVQKALAAQEAAWATGATVRASDLSATSRVEGRVVGVIKRTPKEIAGSLRPLTAVRKVASLGGGLNTERRVFIPQDARLPNIHLRTRQAAELEGMRILVRLDSWTRTSVYPDGHWTTIMGKAGDPRVEGDVILHEHGVITREFSSAVLRCLPPADFTPDEREISKRMDLRKVLTCSVDPPGCKDIDDALSCEDLGDGTFRVGVHIADVTHFVKPGAPIDVEAAERCTTVYLVDRRTDMLPGLLTTDLCSLVGGTTRLTFSVLWHLDKDGHSLAPPTFTKAVITSDAALTYQQAQERIDDSKDNSDLTKCLRNLMHISKCIRRRRIDGGALELASTEVKLTLENETMDPTDVSMYVFRDTNRMIEEMMLFANSAVARRITESFPLYSVLRRHPLPKMEELSKLQRLLKEHGVEDFSFASSKDLSDSLARAVRKNDDFFNKLVRILTTRCMNQAVYFCTGNVAQDEYRHYGLAADFYTHFTSPIRRYADVLVHRLLAAAIGIAPLPEMLSSKDKVADQCDLMNRKHHNAQWAGRASVDFFVCRFFLKHGAQTESAVVLRVKANGLHVTLPRFGVDGVVLMKEEEHSFDEATATLSHRGGKYNLRVFDRVMVEVTATDADFRFKTVLNFKGLDTEFVQVDHRKMARERKAIADEMFPNRIVKDGE